MKNKNIMGCKQHIDISLFDVFYIIFAIAMLWMSVTSTVQAFKDPKLTRTELTLLIPKTFTLHFQEPQK